MKADELFHPDHVVPAAEFIPAFPEHSHLFEAHMRVEAFAVVGEIFVLGVGMTDAGVEIEHAHLPQRAQIIVRRDFPVERVFDDGEHVGIFRMDRFAARPDVLDEAADPFPAEFDFNKYLQTSFRMFGTDHKTVELVCTNDVVDAILDKFGKDVEIEPIVEETAVGDDQAKGAECLETDQDGEDAEDTEKGAEGSESAGNADVPDEGHFRVKVDVAVSNVFFSWVFGFGGKVSIAGPLDVKNEFKSFLMRVVMETFRA